MIQTHLEAWWFEARCKNVWEGREGKLREKSGAQGRGQQIESQRRQSHPKDLPGGRATDKKLGGQNKDSSQRNEKQTTQGGGQRGEHERSTPANEIS